MVRAKGRKPDVGGSHQPDTPPKFNMEPQNGWVSKFGISFSRGWFSGSMLIFRGVNTWNLLITHCFWLSVWIFGEWSSPQNRRTHLGSCRYTVFLHMIFKLRYRWECGITYVSCPYKTKTDLKTQHNWTISCTARSFIGWLFPYLLTLKKDTSFQACS